MYSNPSIKKPKYDPRVHGERRAHMLERARKHAEMRGDVRLSRFDRVLLASDRLLRRLVLWPLRQDS